MTTASHAPSSPIIRTFFHSTLPFIIHTSRLLLPGILVPSGPVSTIQHTSTGHDFAQWLRIPPNWTWIISLAPPIRVRVVGAAAEHRQHAHKQRLSRQSEHLLLFSSLPRVSCPVATSLPNSVPMAGAAARQDADLSRCACSSLYR